MIHLAQPTQNAPEREKGVFEQFEEFTAMTSGLERNFSLQDLLTDAFLQKHTQYKTFADFAAACGADLSDIDALEKREDTSFLEKTDFDSVEALLNAAMEAYVDGFFGDDA